MLISAPEADMPPTSPLLTAREYKRLLTDLRRIIREGKDEAQRAAAQSLIESYWSIGQRIAKEKLTTRASYHNAILTDLSADLSIDLRTLQRTVTFFQTYKRPPRIEGLNWAHYRVLMQLQDPTERAFYQQLALTDALSVKRLTIAIQSDHYQSALDQPKGKPLQLPRPRDPSYLYKAEVRDVIDADTLLLDIDLGFEVIRRQSIRLARIDAPPRDTPNGAQGRRFVREQLATARTLVINTRKYDIHRRYVAHVFYAFNKRGIEHTFLKGRYLNQELVDKGFAKVV
jgi:endonuclease YncB( thermonuclease family)